MKEKESINHFKLGLEKHMLGIYEAALDHYNLHLSQNPICASTYSNRAAIKFILNQPLPALEDYNQALKLNKDFAEAYYGRAIVKAKLNFHKEAIFDFDKSLKLNPQDAESYGGRGISKDHLRQHLAAIQDFSKAINIKPKYTEMYNSRGIAKDHLCQHLDAINDFNKALELNPNFPEAYNSRGVAKGKLNQYKAAIADFNNAIKLTPDYGNAYFGRGMANYHLQNYTIAILDYTKAIELNSQLSDLYIYRGNSYYNLGEKKQAIADYCMAIPYNLNLLSKKQHHIKISRLLKFREVNARNLSIIQNREIWFAHPDTFDDTQDGTYLLQLFPEHDSVKQAVSSMLSYSCFGLTLESEELHVDISINKENIMWAQYGDSSKGICLHYQYRPEKALQSTQFRFDKISYVNEINLDENISLYDTLQHGFFTKKTDFDFENECRFITVSRENYIQGQIVHEADLGLSLVAVDFGVKCSQADKQKIFDVVSARDDGKPVLFYELKNAAAGTFKFKRTRLLR